VRRKASRPAFSISSLAIYVMNQQLADLLQDGKPLVVDTMAFTWYRSIPGAVGLEFSRYENLQGTFSDETQKRIEQHRDIRHPGRGRPWRQRPRECPANGGMTTQGVRSVGSIADRGNGDAMGVAVDYDGG
jgi:hypothetical protein